MDRHRPLRDFRLFSVSRQFVGMASVDADRGVKRRDLLDLPREFRQDALERPFRRDRIRPRHDRPLRVERIGRRAEAQRRRIGLFVAEHAVEQLRPLPHEHGQHAARRGIERPAVAAFSRPHHPSQPDDGVA